MSVRGASSRSLPRLVSVLLSRPVVMADAGRLPYSPLYTMIIGQVRVAAWGVIRPVMSHKQVC